MQSRSKRSSEVALLSHSSALISASIGSSSTRVTRARVESSTSSQSIVQQKLEAARSKQGSLAWTSAASASVPSSSAAAVRSSAPVKRRSPAQLSLSKKQQQNKSRLAKMRKERDAAADDEDATEDQQKQSAAEASKQSLIPVAAGSPAHWEPIDPAHGNSTLVLLSKDNPKHKAELAQVQQSWTRTGGVGAIVSVHRVQNLTLWQAYEAKKAELQKSGALTQGDAIVYHGSRQTAPELIHAGSVGFDPSKGTSLAGYCWFAEHASYSSGFFSVASSSTVPFGPSDYAAYMAAVQTAPYAGFKQIFQVQLTVTSGAARAPGVFIVPHAARAYPQYLITFQ